MVPNGSEYADYPVFAGSGTKVKPSPDAKYAQGMLPGETFPAEWANYLFNGATGGITRLNADTNSIKKELNSILSAYGIANNADAYNQLLTALNRIYPQVCTCDTAAATETKSVAITGDGVILKAGNVYVITMTNGNTYANGSSTYPKLSINSGTAKALCDANGNYLKAGAWAAGDTITVLYTGTKFLMATRAVTDKIENGNESPVTSNAVSCVISDDPNPTVLTGPELGVGANFKVLFKAAISASDTTTPLSLTYNGTAYTVKARKDGALVNVLGHETATNIYKYLQAYTTIEFVFDGTNLIIMGNPVLLSNTDYTIYSNGLFEYYGYSTTEHFTGRYWIDGKKIYSKVWITTANTYNDGDYYNIGTYVSGFSLPNYESITNCFITNKGQTTLFESCVIRYNNGALQIAVNKIHYTGSQLVIEYTKTTD